MTDLFHVRQGRGRPIVVIHGGLGLDHSYMRALDRMGDIAELIYIDVRGNGRSSHERLATATWTVADDIDALRAEPAPRSGRLGHAFALHRCLREKYPTAPRARHDLRCGLFEHAPADRNLAKREASPLPHLPRSGRSAR